MKKRITILTLVLLMSGVALAIWIKNSPSSKVPLHSNVRHNDVAVNGSKTIRQSDTGSVQDDPVLHPGIIIASEPVTYKNLQVFFLYGHAEIEGERYVTLDDALKGKLVVVRETSDVNELKLDNRSSSYIYINSGDIVRGGKQDRTIQFDVVIAPKTRNVNLASFCVEAGRWDNRGNESAHMFSSSQNALSSKQLKAAAKMSRDQGEVWDKVKVYQDQANENITKNYSGLGKVDVKSDISSSSLQLTLENKNIRNINGKYRQHILEHFRNRKNAIGMACFINGKLASIDIFNNEMLFSDLLDKMLNSVIDEAISEDIVKNYKPADTANVYGFIRQSSRLLSADKVNKSTLFSTYKTKDHVMLFVTDDRDQGKWLHKNWLETDDDPGQRQLMNSSQDAMDEIRNP